MKPEQTREIIKLVREHFRLQAEVRTLAAILEVAERLDQAPFKWLDALKQARQTPGYRTISEQFEPQLAEVERSLEDTELGLMLEKIPPTQFLN
jgi:hypothetical protein